MKNFLKNNGQIIGAVIFVAVVIFAAGRLHTTQAALCRQIEQKVNQELYDREIKSISERLKRIEGKIDAIIISTNPSVPGSARDRDPGR